MKKLLVPFLIIATLLTFVRIGFALSGPTVTTPNIKQLLVDGDMEATNAVVAFADGDMEAAGTGSWTPSQATLSKQTGTPHTGLQSLRVAYNGFADGAAVNGTVTVGHVYHITGWARGDGTSSPLVTSAWMSPTYFAGTSSNSWQSFDVTVEATATYLQFGSHDLSSGHYVEFDDITVTDVTAGSWLAIAATLSKQTTNPHGGNQVLRVTADGTQPYADSYQAVLTEGKRYRITGWARGDGSVYPSIFFGGNNQVWSGTVSAAWQRFDVTSAPIGGGQLFLIAYNVTGAGQYVEFDDVFITEVTGYTQVQDTQKLVDGDMEKTNTQPSFVNLDFEGAAGPPPASWSQYQALATRVAGTRTGGSGSYVAHVAYDTVNASGLMYQDGLTAGHTYRVTGWYRTDGIHMLVMLGPSGIIFNDTVASWTYFDATGIQVGADNYLRFQSNDFNLGAGYFELDDVSITDVTAGSYVTYHAIVSKQTTTPHDGKQVIRVALDGVNPAAIAYQQPLTAGKKYKITGWMRSDGSSTPYFNDASLQNFCSGTLSTSWQYCSNVFIAQNSNLAFEVTNYSNNGYAEFDDVMVTEDKGKQQVIDKQVVVEGDMEGLPIAVADAAMEAAGTSSWVPSQSALSKQTTNPHSGSQLLRITATAAAGARYPQAYQIALTVGKTYRITGYLRSDGTQTPLMSGGGTILFTGTTATTWQPFDVTFVANYTYFVFFFSVTDPAGTEYIEADDISVIDIGTTAWSPGSSNATLTKTTTGQHGGKYALRVAWASGTYAYASGGAIFTPGKTYRMTGWVRSDGAVTPLISLSGGQTVWTGTTATSWQRIDTTFKANYDSLYLIYYASSAAWMEWDDLFATATN